MRRIHIVLLIVLSLSIILAVMVSTSPKASLIEQISAVFLGFIGSLAAVSEIIGLFDRIGIPEKVQPIEARFAQIQQAPFETTVGIWGPIGSGKSWLINSFAWAMQQKYKGKYLGLQYKINKLDQGFSLDLSETPEPTSEVRVSSFRFERQKTSGDFYEAMSSFTHEIHIFDNPGKNSSFDDVLLNLANVDIVIIVLDPTRIRGKSILSLDDYGYFTQTEYAQMVRKLFSVLEKGNSEKQKLYAVCITKADLIHGSMYLHPDAIIEALFGHEMSEAIKTPQKGVVQTFTTSSFGYITGTKTPNRDLNGLGIRDKINWQPYGVEFPFFWAFEIKEKNLLEKILKKTLIGKLSHKNTLRHYVPYPKAKYE